MALGSTLRVSLYRYDPSIAGAIIFVFLFTGFAVAHCYIAWRYRAKFMIACILGTIFEVIGFAGRAASHNNTHALYPYVVQNLFILLAPVLFAATIYMILGRIMRATQAQVYSMIRTTRLTKTFVTSDVICFLIQGQGGSFQAIDKPIFATIGRWAVIGGLALQIFIFCYFMIITMVFHKRIIRRPTSASLEPGASWKRHMYALYIVSILILVRNSVRIIEFIQGYSGWIISHEFMLYVFDAVPMVLVVFILFFVHPSRLLARNNETLLSISSSADTTQPDIPLAASTYRVPHRTKA